MVETDTAYQKEEESHVRDQDGLILAIYGGNKDHQSKQNKEKSYAYST